MHSLEDKAKLNFKHLDLTVSRIFLLLSKTKIKKTLSFGSSIIFKRAFDEFKFKFSALSISIILSLLIKADLFA